MPGPMFDAVSDGACLADEPSRLDLAVGAGLLLRVSPPWVDVHGLPFGVLVTRAAIRAAAPGFLFDAAGEAYRAARPDARGVVEFDAEVGVTRKGERRVVGATIRTVDDPIEGRCHVIALSHEDG